jgi:hypothetical protein
VALFSGLCPVRLEAGELFAGERRLKVVIREKDNESRELITPSCIFSMKLDASGMS